MKIVAGLLALLHGCAAFNVRVNRRHAIAAALASAALPLHADEPEPETIVVQKQEPVAVPMLSGEEEAERMRRKMEALRKQDRRGAADVKVLFGPDYQAGKRETKQQNNGFSLPVLLPQDVGGVNLNK